MHLDHVCCKHSARILVTLLFNWIYLNSCFISYCVALSLMLFFPKRSNKLKQTSQVFIHLQSSRLANISNWRCINMFRDMWKKTNSSIQIMLLLHKQWRYLFSSHSTGTLLTSVKQSPTIGRRIKFARKELLLKDYGNTYSANTYLKK